MDKKNTVLTSDFFIGILVNKLAIRFGLNNIRSRDCHHISKDIHRYQPQEPVSEKTLLRMIGVDKTFTNLSITSLDHVARFLGYLHFDAFVKNTKEERGVGNVPLNHHDQTMLMFKSINPFLRIITINELPDKSYETVAGFCQTHHQNYYLYTIILPNIIENAFKKADIDFLSRFFYLPHLFDEKNWLHIQLFMLMQHFGIAMRKHAKVRDRLLPIYAQNAVAQAFYFEFFVDVDYLTLHHHKAITLYLEYKQTAQSNVFGHCLLFLKSFLNEEEGNCRKHIEILRSIPKTFELHIIPVSRYYGSELLHRHFYGNGISDEFWDLVIQISRVARNYYSFDDKPHQFHIKILNALLLCQEWGKLQFYLETIVLTDYKIDELVTSKDVYLGKLLMYCALAAFLSGNEVQAKIYFYQIKPLQDIPYERDFEHLYYLLIKDKICIDDIVAEEGKAIARKLKYPFFESLFSKWM